jgi:hypothetical protein
MNTMDDYLEFLIESYTATTTKRGRSQKIKSTTGLIGVSLARKKNDPMYIRMMYHKHMYMKLKEQLQKKYKSKATVLARQRANEYKKED